MFSPSSQIWKLVLFYFWDKPSVPPINSLNLSITLDCNPQLNYRECLFHLAACWLIFDCFTWKMCRGKQRRFPDIHVARDIRVIPSISEGAWKLVTKCLRNPRKQKFPACFLPFSLTFPYVSHSLSHFLCFP